MGMHKSGFTLIELLVYMAIMGFIIVVAGRVFSDSTIMRVRSQNMLKTSEEVGKVINLINEDISQMGTKAHGQSSEIGFSIIASEEVYVSETDFSSFWLFRSNATSASNTEIKFDSLVFRKAAFDNNGEFLGVREISWAVNAAGQLHRNCKTIYGDIDDECPQEVNAILIAENIKKFTLYPSAPGVVPSIVTSSVTRDTVFSTEGETGTPFSLLANLKGNARYINVSFSGSGKNAVAELSGNFIKNDSDSDNRQDDIFNEIYLAEPNKTQYGECLEIPIKDGETYAIEFNMLFPVGSSAKEEVDAARRDSNSTQFLPGLDHIAVGLRYNDGSKISNVSSDVLLYAPQSQEAASLPRYAEFSAKGNPAVSGKKACVALTFAFYSPLANQGKYRFSNFKVYKKQTGAYHFVKVSNNYSSDFANKYATEDDSDKELHKKNVKAFELILEIDRNGEVAGTYSKDSSGMAIPVPNNGVTQ